MKIYKYFHSCLLLDDGKTRILFDPGNYSFIEGRLKPENFKNIDAIFITHSHPDHADINALKTIISINNPRIISNPGVKEVLNKEGIDCEIIESDGFKSGNFLVKPVAATHEENLLKKPSNNIAYLVNCILLNPGDSLDKNLYSIKPKVLALPIFGSWGKSAEFGEFAKNVKPEVVIPIHDGMVIDSSLEDQYKQWDKYLSREGIRFVPLRKPEEFLEI